MNRRYVLWALATIGTTVGAAVLTPVQADVRPRRRRIRRRIRRRMRRRIVIRSVFGRPFWVVPVGMVVGWVLVHADRVVVVKEIQVVERDGQKIEVATLADSSGNTEPVEMLREDTAENRANLHGSVLADDDRLTPGVDDEIETEVER